MSFMPMHEWTTLCGTIHGCLSISHIFQGGKAACMRIGHYWNTLVWWPQYHIRARMTHRHCWIILLLNNDLKWNQCDDLSDVVWKTPLECQCSWKNIHFQTCFDLKLWYFASIIADNPEAIVTSLLLLIGF